MLGVQRFRLIPAVRGAVIGEIQRGSWNTIKVPVSILWLVETRLRAVL